MLSLLLACTDPDDHEPAESGDAGEVAAPSQLVPLPQLIKPGTGTFTLNADASLGATGPAVFAAEQLANYLRRPTGFALPVESTGEITLTLSDDLPAEAYTLEVTTEGVQIAASDAAGLFYGSQTLRQLFPAAIFGAQSAQVWTVPVVQIADVPRFEWRGVMIDVARHFFTVTEIERQIELLALHKLNRLHLHLTDDQGWRIEILSWPNLATWGGSTEVGGGSGGYYTQDEFRGLVAFAAERHVTLIPEIDFPGHAHAALASYPELNESGVAAELYTGEAVITTPLWLAGPETARFVADVWHEVAALSPASVVHIGGDEAIDTSDADYRAFVQSLQATVALDGKELLGWDEIGIVPLNSPFLAQYWYDADNAREAVKNGARIIASPAEYAYFDMIQSPDAAYGQVWAGIVGTEQAYDWDPELEGVSGVDIAGVEACAWTEYIDDEEKLDFMLWPRLAALAEVGWTLPGERDWAGFSERLGWHGARLDVLGVGYYRTVEVEWMSAL